MRSTTVVLLAICVAVSCDRPSTADSGFPEVVSPAPDPGAVLQASEIYRLGMMEGEGPEVFGRINVIAADPPGNAYVMDELAHEIRVFGPDGRHLHSFGREGEGPGEFDGVRGILFHPDGSVWFTQGHDYRVLRRSAEGDTTLAFSLDVEAPRVTQAERDSVLELNRHYASGAGLDPDLIPETRAAIERLVRVAPGWVGVFPHLGPDTGRFMDVFTPAGEHRARADLGYVLSLTSPAPCVRNGVLYGVARDEFDVQYVVALDLGLDEFR